MSQRIDTTIEFRRTQSVGPALVYILPHQVEEFLKIGFSRDPLQRMQALHRRYFEFFDLERAILIDTAQVREARRIETALKGFVADHRAPAPLDIREEAGGGTEWYRGAYETLSNFVSRFETEGHVVIRDAREWTRRQLLANAPLLFEWSTTQLRAIEDSETDRARLAHALVNALDAYGHFGIDLSDTLSNDVAHWYAQRTDKT